TAHAGHGNGSCKASIEKREPPRREFPFSDLQCRSGAGRSKSYRPPGSAGGSGPANEKGPPARRCASGPARSGAPSRWPGRLLQTEVERVVLGLDFDGQLRRGAFAVAFRDLGGIAAWQFLVVPRLDGDLVFPRRDAHVVAVHADLVVPGRIDEAGALVTDFA